MQHFRSHHTAPAPPPRAPRAPRAPHAPPLHRPARARRAADDAAAAARQANLQLADSRPCCTPQGCCLVAPCLTVWGVLFGVLLWLLSMQGRVASPRRPDCVHASVARRPVVRWQSHTLHATAAPALEGAPPRPALPRATAAALRRRRWSLLQKQPISFPQQWAPAACVLLESDVEQKWFMGLSGARGGRGQCATAGDAFSHQHVRAALPYRHRIASHARRSALRVPQRVHRQRVRAAWRRQRHGVVQRNRRVARIPPAPCGAHPPRAQRAAPSRRAPRIHG